MAKQHPAFADFSSSVNSSLIFLSLQNTNFCLYLFDLRPQFFDASDTDEIADNNYKKKQKETATRKIIFRIHEGKAPGIYF